MSLYVCKRERVRSECVCVFGCFSRVDLCVDVCLILRRMVPLVLDAAFVWIRFEAGVNGGRHGNACFPPLAK